MEEIVANSVATVFADETAVRQFAETNKTTLEKIKAWLDEFIAQLKESIQKVAERIPELRAMQNDGELLEKVRDTVMKALDETGGVRVGEKEPNTVYSINPDFASDIAEWNENGRNPLSSFVLGETSDVLQGLGARENDIFVRGEKINKKLKDHPEISLDIIKKIPEILDDPAMILASKNE